MRSTFFIFIVLVQFYSLPIIAQGHVKLVSYDFTQCGLKDTAKIRQRVAQFSNIDSAEIFLRDTCKFSNTSKYLLSCRNCPTGIIQKRSPTGNRLLPSADRTYMGSLISKGNNEVFSQQKIKEIFSDSTAIFDTLRLHLFSAHDLDKFFTIYFKAEGSSLKLYPQINKTKREILVSNALLKPAKKYSVYYLNNGKPQEIATSFYAFFVSTAEKQELSLRLKDLETAEPGISRTDDGLNYFENILSQKYKRTDADSLSKWLAKLNP